MIFKIPENTAMTQLPLSSSLQAHDPIDLEKNPKLEYLKKITISALSIKTTLRPNFPEPTTGHARPVAELETLEKSLIFLSM